MAESKPIPPAKAGWPLWKKLTIVAVALIVAIALGVGLGVGLTRDNGDDSDDSGDNSGNDGDNGDNNNDNNNTGIWQPDVGASWQIILKYPIKLEDDSTDGLAPNVSIWDLDVYDNDITIFQALTAADKKIICYFSAGSWEDWRDDADDFDKADLGKGLDGWAGEKWLNVSSPAVRKIMQKRIKYAADKGCNAIDPDNVDGYQNDNGLNLTEADTVSFVKFLSEEAAQYNMSTGLKNAGGIIDKVIDYVHFSVNEQCIEYSECETFSKFIDANKPVFNIEYPSKAPKVSSSAKSTICATSGDAKGSNKFSKVIKKMILDGWVEYCGETETFTTEVDKS
ncbi:glycoside hydrolase superfamily [Ilyonectria robusta]|uniref:glycoside hydrolase superfamily n=1 Tax=Ilyonectria robusta TaxID=1079257 RepID=UPI001E8CBEA4|nr:glycoside hydrolase superfamily [Ilyonectria robusta]KAH8699988.1 glycoside hydrolase superfamily [Ilyonectria robusta]